MRLLALAALLVLSACGGRGTTTRCTGEVQGRVNGTLSVCNELEQRYLQNLDEFVLTAAYTELPTSFVMAAEWQIKSEPRVRQYNQDSANVECKITVKKGTPSWLARKGAGVPSSGTCALTIAEVIANPQDGNIITYKVRGSMTARLEAEPGTGSTEFVNLTTDFCQGDAVFCPAP